MYFKIQRKLKFSETYYWIYLKNAFNIEINCHKDVTGDALTLENRGFVYGNFFELLRANIYLLILVAIFHLEHNSASFSKLL